MIKLGKTNDVLISDNILKYFSMSLIKQMIFAQFLFPSLEICFTNETMDNYGIINFENLKIYISK